MTRIFPSFKRSRASLPANMECVWDAVLLQRFDQLPPELLHVIEYGNNEQYLQAISKASLDPRHTYILFAHCEHIFAHVCATLRSHGSFASAVATLGRILPFAPYLMPYAERLLAYEAYEFSSHVSSDEDLLFLLGLFRLFAFDQGIFRKFIRPAGIAALLQSTSRPVVYLAIRVLQIYLSGADHWFERMIKKHLGEDTPEGNINGQWDDKVIDYRFLTLWEEDRFEKMLKFVDGVKSQNNRSNGRRPRVISEDDFDQSTAFVGGMLLPRTTDAEQAASSFGNELVETPTVTENVKNLASALRDAHPVLLAGLPGSGKTRIVRQVAQRLCNLDRMVTLHLNEQSDAKLLVGIYTTGETPGSFVWKPGVLTTAVQEGRWVLIEDLDRAPTEIMGTLLPLVEKRELLIPNRKQTVHAAQGFRIIATVRTTINHRGVETRPMTHMLGARHWQNVNIQMPSMDEQRQIAGELYPSLSDLLPQFMVVYERLQASRQRTVLIEQSTTGVMRAISPRDLLKWCSRVTNLLQHRTAFTSNDIDDILLEAIDCFVGALPEGPAWNGMAAIIAEELHIDPQRRDHLLTARDVRYDVDKIKIAVGRYTLPRAQQSKKVGIGQGSFSTNLHTSRMLERVAAAIVNHEPLLLVGETGVGKTTAVQHLAIHLSKKLVPFNLSQQSEAGDFLGGFKPISARSLIVPMKDEFDELFGASFSFSKNQQFLELLNKQMAKSNWKAVCKLWQQALKMVGQRQSEAASREGAAPSKKRKVESRKVLDLARWDDFARRVADMEQRLAAGGGTFAFGFVEGTIVKAVRSGDWVLLDEINLASPDTLESIASLFDTNAPSLLLTESGDVERVEAHPDFRVFAAMNPATDVGKKDLPPGIRSRFTELYVESPDKDIKSLQSIVRSYLRNEAIADQAIALDTSTLYQKIIVLSEQNKLVDGAGQKPHFSLRTLTRTLSYAKHISPLCNLRRALYEGFQMSFLTFLGVESAGLVQPLLEQNLFGKNNNARANLQKALRKPSDGHHHVRGYPGSKHWVRRGNFDLEEQPHYILTPFVRNNLENLVRATSTWQFPVLVQGPTSSGKTSMIEYLAKRTGHKFVRINNHEHTDLQEYLGTYVSGADGRLQFQEGILVKALREGHWIVLDELNLAPTDVLEALNRLLDDNRELMVPETQEVIRPHEHFMLFATQNPVGLYGGRKILSRAFRNRFLELHFDDIPVDELQEILHRRTELPESWCKRIVTVYRELSILRQENRLFEQKSFATLRDLFRWALRKNDTIGQLAANGFMLLAERVRNPEERRTLKAIVESVMSKNGPRVTIDERALYARNSAEVLHHNRSANGEGVVVWTKAMRRLYVLVSRAIENNEPVLLVGETGCGKTTVCQMLSDAFGKELHTVNAHQNTETGDLVGSQRPVRNRAVIEANLRHQLLSSPLLQSLDTGPAPSTDELLDAYDRALASLDSPQASAYRESKFHAEVQIIQTRFKALFEWIDGSLVNAMKSGAYFLLDEISLADDSVLERINSVLEPQRSILLAEKGSLDSYVSAAHGFQFLATMNPGGDYGKRELSPALRNRFTEIWVPSLNDAEDVTEIVSVKLAANAKRYASAIVSFAQWFKERYNTSASSSLSIRDALAWVTFVNAAGGANLAAAMIHGAAMVYVDTLGANPAGLMSMNRGNLDQERQLCLNELSRLLGLDATVVYSAPVDVDTAGNTFSTGPFTLSKKNASNVSDLTFSFDPPTTRVNAMRIVRALQLPKPVMIEGSPGVGKTALVVAIASAVGAPLTRINLSEQTDLLDLFGCDAPVEGAKTGMFSWRDAPFLRAMKNGEWVLLDEMNLASQSILEGLNACLDHRGEVFLPELGQIFTRHPEFRLFAAQNPHHQGGGRKGLPASFVNRFTVVFADGFRSNDLMLICRRSFPQLEASAVEQAVQFLEQLDFTVSQEKRVGTNGGPWEFNLRDLFRWLSLTSSEQGLLKSGTARDFVEFLFSQRFRSVSDGAFVNEMFLSCFQDSPYVADVFPSVSSEVLQLGLGILPRDRDTANCSTLTTSTQRSWPHLRILQSVMLCVQQRWPVVLTGPSGSGKTALIARLAAAVGASVATIAMNAETDVMDLLGGYEQSGPGRQTLQMLDQFRASLKAQARSICMDEPASESTQILGALRECENSRSLDPTRLSAIMKAIGTYQSPEVRTLLENMHQCTESIERAHFEWIDGVLIDALQRGRWLVLDNANLSSSSVLDRLNSLLEPDGALIVNEHSLRDGSPRVIRPHPRFRIFLTLDPRYGELSRAMRNRAVELYLHEAEALNTTGCTDPLQSESVLTRLRPTKALHTIGDHGHEPKEVTRVLADHMSVSDGPLLPRFQTQLVAGLFGYSMDNSRSWKTTWPSARMDLPRRIDFLPGFYEETIGQTQMPADFASVQVSRPACSVSIDVADGKLSLQTIHPLNNQPLICSSQQVFLSALSMAFIHDSSVELDSLRQLVTDLESDSGLLSKLHLFERSSNLLRSQFDRKAKDSRLLNWVKTILEIVSRWLPHSQDVSQSDLLMARKAFGQLFAFLLIFLKVFKEERLEATTISACLSVGQSIVGSYTVHASCEFLACFVEVFQALAGAISPPESIRGRACATLWSVLRPLTPATVDELEGVLNFEGTIDCFDRIAFTFEFPLEVMVDLRISFSRALELARAGEHNTEELSTKLDNLMRTQDGQDPDRPASRTPHFLSTFKRLHRHLSTLALESWCVPQTDIAKLELLAKRKTKDSILRFVGVNTHSIHNRFHLLGGSVTDSAEQASYSIPEIASLFQQIAETEQISLARIELLETEVQTLGRIVSSHAHLLTCDELVPLDVCLEALTYEVLNAILKLPKDSKVHRLASSLLTLLDRNADDSVVTDAIGSLNSLSSALDSTMQWMSSALRVVVTYLRTISADGYAKLSSASTAWASFACACLELYMPATPFDPALEPQLVRRIHRRHYEGLSSRLQALRMFTQALTGEEGTLRARFLERDIDELGHEPQAIDVCRPRISQMSELQSDLDSLMRILRPLRQTGHGQTSFLPLEPKTFATIVKVRTRIIEKYRVYEDITAPILGFLDCLLTAHRLATKASALSRPDFAESMLTKVIPFVHASCEIWLQDKAFVRVLSGLRSHIEETCWLDALVIRTSTLPITESSFELREGVEQLFARFYSRWRAQLNQEQKETIAKSSLYKFRREETDQDEISTEDLEELFPATTTTTDALTHHAQDLAPEIARVHFAVFVSQPVDDRSISKLLRQWSMTVSQGHSTNVPGESSIPAFLQSIGGLIFVLEDDQKPRSLYNLYNDSNVGETRKLSNLLRRTMRRFTELHLAWPEHATPLEVLRTCDDILLISFSAPLSRFFSLLDKLHATVNEWQKVASRGYSVSEVLEELTNLVVSWRQLELLTWVGLFDREWNQCEKDAASWWYIAYETIIAATLELEASPQDLQHHTEDLLRTLTGFLTSSGIGEYSARLRMLHSFEAHLAMAKVRNPRLDTIQQALANFTSYYVKFESIVKDTLSKGSIALEKDVRNVVQLASWKDRNIDVLRQSAQSSHKKLLRLVRKYRALLAQSVAPILQDAIPIKLDDDHHRVQTRIVPSRSSNLDVPVSLSGLHAWDERPDRLRNAIATADLVRTKARQAQLTLHGPSQLRSFSNETEHSITEFQEATPTVLTDENKAFISHLKNRKRRLLADILKDVRNMGFHTAMSPQVLKQQRSMDAIFASVTALGHSKIFPQIARAEHEFHRLLGAMQMVRDSARKHSEDLTPAEVARCISLLESMLHRSILQHQALGSAVSRISKLERVVNLVCSFSCCNTPTVREGPEEEVAKMAFLEPILRFCISTLQLQERMSGNSYAVIVEDLEAGLTELAQLGHHTQALPSLPPNIESSDSMRLHDQYRAFLNGLQSKVDTAIKLHPETGPVISHILRWIDVGEKDVGNSCINGHIPVEMTNWLGQLFETIDVMLAAVQDVEKAALIDTNGAAWFTRQQDVLIHIHNALSLDNVSHRLLDLMSHLQDPRLGGSSSLSFAAAVCHNLFPIVDAYRHATIGFTALSCDLYAETSRTGNKLATRFIKLANRGFCSPSDKAPEHDAQSGGIEAGTGLGEGEGGEDISKDVGEDEDLSELAQDRKRETNGEEGMEDDKDAVTMADEETEGEIGDDGLDAQDDNGSDPGSTAETADPDEETADGDHLGASAVDEKMWDGGHNESQQEKEAGSSRGRPDIDDVAAANERGADEGGASTEEQAMDDMEAGASEADKVEQPHAEKADPHAQDQQNLELPEEIDIDGNKSVASDPSDVESMSDAQQDGEDATPGDYLENFDAAGEADSPRDGAREETSQDEQAIQDNEREDDGRHEEADTLMQENPRTELDEHTDGLTSAQQGSGPQEDESNHQISVIGRDLPSQENEDISGDDLEHLGAAGGRSQAQGDKALPEPLDANEERHGMPFKQLGNALEQWYDQHREIEEAQRMDEAEPSFPTDTDMADAQFQHLPDNDTQADTQALGAASTEQSTALNEDNALSVNELNRAGDAFNEGPDAKSRDEVDQVNDDRMKIGPSDDIPEAQQSRSFIGEPGRSDADVEMRDDLFDREHDKVEEVDEQLTKAHIFDGEASEELSIEEARSLWTQCEERTRNLALALAEHLRLILQPTQATKMRGDFRTGKRLNIKRIIPYIASSYKRDKIWMRRSMPSKRSYQVMLAIDDSKSMTEGQSRDLAFETVALVAKSMSTLEVGDLSVVGFGEKVKIAHDFSMPFTSDAGAELFRQFGFCQSKTNVRKLLTESIEIFRAARVKAAGSASDLWQLQLIISDGICEDHPSIRQLVRQAREERIMIVFIIVDPAAQGMSSSDSPKQSILDLQSAEFVEDSSGEMQLKMVKYLDTFPFRYYLIVRNVQELPGVLAGALRQWFAEIVDTRGA